MARASEKIIHPIIYFKGGKMQTKRDVMLYVLTYAMVFGFLGIIGYVVYQTMAPGVDASKVTASPLLMLIVGNLFSALTLVLTYFYGGSKGADDKKEG